MDRWSAVHTAAAAASYFPLPAHAPYCQLCVILCESYWSVAPFAAVVLSRLIHFSQRTEEPFFFFIFFLLSLPPLVVLMEEEMLGRWLGEFSNQCFAFTSLSLLSQPTISSYFAGKLCLKWKLFHFLTSNHAFLLTIIILDLANARPSWFTK